MFDTHRTHPVRRPAPIPPAAQFLLRGFDLHKRNDLSGAEDLYRRVVSVEPGNFQALHLLGLIMTQTRRLEDGLGMIDKALAIKPDFLDALNSRGNALQSLGRHEEALATYSKALAIKPSFVEALINRGNALNALKRYEEALHSYDRALALKRDSAEAHYNRGVALAALTRMEEAEVSYGRAAALRPGYFDALFNRGNALRLLRRFEDAVLAYDQALAMAPRHAVAQNNRGDALQALGRYGEARAAFDRALEAAPTYSDARFNAGLLALGEGDFAAGWPAFEHRWNTSAPLRRNLDAPQPLWRGQPLANQSILVYEEQGLGDVLQFCRYLPMLEASGARVTLYVRRSLAALLQEGLGSVRVVSANLGDERFDWQCPMMSLPIAFGTDLHTIPNNVPYLAAEPARARRWREALGAGGFKVGVAWAGSQMGRALGKCFSPEWLLGLGGIPGVRLISLQKDGGPLLQGVETPGADFDSGPDAFLDTAAVMTSLDLVISADTSIPHLAGALGRPVWVALPYVADWRWMRERPDTPWYPTMRLFRQRTRDDWADVFANIESALRAYLARA